MFATNGRVRREKRKEKGSISNKEFKCTECGVLRRMGKIEFGEKVVCLKCGAPMEEV